jgi:hypothetical protein
MIKKNKLWKNNKFVLYLFLLFIIAACQTSLLSATHVVVPVKEDEYVRIVFKNEPLIAKKIINRNLTGLYISQLETWLNNNPEYILSKGNGGYAYKYNYIEKNQLKCNIFNTNRIKTIISIEGCGKLSLK